MVDRDAVARVLDRYGLRPTGRMSARNGVVRIATTGGPKALTRYPAERPTRSIASEHSILRHLEEATLALLATLGLVPGLTLSVADAAGLWAMPGGSRSSRVPSGRHTDRR